MRTNELVVPEQSAEQWLAGGNAEPLPISLDPARRSMWESALKKKEPSISAVTPPSMAADDASMSASEHLITAAELDSAPDPAASVDTQIMATTASKPNEPVVPRVAKLSVETSPPVEPSEDRLPLQGEETYASTSYKSRIIGLHIEDQLERHRNKGNKGPLMVALQGPQGCGECGENLFGVRVDLYTGKTTLCEALVGYIQREPHNLKAAVLSLDGVIYSSVHCKPAELGRSVQDQCRAQGAGTTTPE